MNDQDLDLTQLRTLVGIHEIKIQRLMHSRVRKFFAGIMRLASMLTCGVVRPYQSYSDYLEKAYRGGRHPLAPAPSNPPATGSRPTSAMRLERKLWAGFSRSAVHDLQRMVRSRASAPAELSYGAFALARWYAFNGQYHTALEYVAIARSASAARRNSPRLLALEVDCLVQIDCHEEARQVLDAFKEKAGELPADLRLIYANTYRANDAAAARRARLDALNEIYAKNGFALVAEADPLQPLVISNLTAPEAIRLRRSDSCKISVLMPVYNAQATIESALRSILAQTWANLEVIVVDDCSSDRTYEITKQIAADDSRVVPIRHSRNRGTYPARNTALERASGQLITTHDGDDWSHPQMLETGASFLLANPQCAGSFLSWARVTQDLVFKGTWRPGGEIVSSNLSSLMFRDSVRKEIGTWDPVLVSADTEFLWRVQAKFGAEAVRWLHKDVPLSLALTHTASLTRTNATHAKTITHGVRREYREAAEWWHKNAKNGADLSMTATGARPFPAPVRIDPNEDNVIRCDVLIIMDFNIKGGAFESTFGYMMAAIQSGKRVAVFQWRRYDLDPEKPLDSRIRALAAEGKIRVAVASDDVVAETVIIGYPAILQHRVDDPPHVDFKHLIVVVNQMAARLFSGADPQYDPLTARRHLREMFGTEGTWVPISVLVRRLMLDDERYPAPHWQIWHPLIDTNAWCPKPLAWQGARRRPVVGRHCRDHYTKWPSDAASLMAAYCADRPCDVRLLGGAEHALQVIKRLPLNWEVSAFDSVDPRSFLSGLDVFVHYPHEDYIEEFGRAVIEALAVGCPAVLPPRFEETFGPAALYAEPADVWQTIDTLWRDERAYIDRTRVGRDFVLRECGFEQLARRLQAIGQSPDWQPAARDRVGMASPISESV